MSVEDLTIQILREIQATQAEQGRALAEIRATQTEQSATLARHTELHADHAARQNAVVDRLGALVGLVNAQTKEDDRLSMRTYRFDTRLERIEERLRTLERAAAQRE